MNQKPRNKFYVDVGWRIRQMRNLKKLSQEYLGERVGVSAQTIQRYECGEIHIPTEALAICAKTLGAPVEHFFAETDHIPANNNINRIGLMAAAEIMELPDDNIRKNVYYLVRSINQFDASQEGDD